MPQRGLDVARQFGEPYVRDRDAEVGTGHVFEFVSFVKDDRAGDGQNPSIGRPLGRALDGEVSEEEMMVHDDDVAFARLAPHLGDEAALPLLAFLSGAGVGARVELAPYGR